MPARCLTKFQGGGSHILFHTVLSRDEDSSKVHMASFITASGFRRGRVNCCHLARNLNQDVVLRTEAISINLEGMLV
jgi:hypothetical protein